MRKKTEKIYFGETLRSSMPCRQLGSICSSRLNRRRSSASSICSLCRQVGHICTSTIKFSLTILLFALIFTANASADNVNVNVQVQKSFNAIAIRNGQADLSTEIVDKDGNKITPQNVNLGKVDTFSIKKAQSFFKIGYKTNFYPAGVAIHTFNEDPAIPKNENGKYYKYRHDWGKGRGQKNADKSISPEYGAGIVLENSGKDGLDPVSVNETMKAAPLLWGVFDNLGVAAEYVFDGGKDVEGKVTDVMQDKYDYENGPNDSWIGYRTVVYYSPGNPSGDLLSAYPITANPPNGRRYTKDREIFVAVAGDFRLKTNGGQFNKDEAVGGLYGTERFIIELYHR